MRGRARLGGLRRAFDGEDLFVEGDRRAIRPDAELITERLAQPLEAPDRLPALAGIEMGAHERAGCLLVGGVFFGQAAPQRCRRAAHPGTAGANGAWLDQPGLVAVIWKEFAVVEVGARHDRRPSSVASSRLARRPRSARRRSRPRHRAEHEHAVVVHDRLLVSGGAPGEVQGLAKVRAGGLGIALGPERLHDLRPMQPMVRGSASSLTTSAARRLRQRPRYRASSTATENRPEELDRQSSAPQAIVRAVPWPRTSGPCGTVAERSSS